MNQARDDGLTENVTRRIGWIGDVTRSHSSVM